MHSLVDNLECFRYTGLRYFFPLKFILDGVQETNGPVAVSNPPPHRTFIEKFNMGLVKYTK
jgi:hypothetical protein